MSSISKKHKDEDMSGKAVNLGHRKEDKETNPMSLAGQISLKDMGSRAKTETEVSSKNIPKSNDRKPVTNFFFAGSLEKVLYHPTTEENAHILELIMVKVHEFLPDSSHDVIISAADSILEIIKSELSNLEKKKEIEELLGMGIGTEDVDTLIGLGSRITDYNKLLSGPDADDEEDDMAVVFEEDVEEGGDEEQDGFTAEVVDVASDDETTAPHTNREESIEGEKVIEQPAVDNKKDLPDLITGQIDEFYLQRKIGSLVNSDDPSLVQSVSNEYMKYLSDHNLSTRDLENELMELMDYEHLDFIKLTIINRWNLVYSIKLAAAKTESERKDLFGEMDKFNHHELALKLLNASDDSNTDITKKRKLSSSGLSPADDKSTKRLKGLHQREPKIIDLDALVFDQGSHLMTSSKVKLPQGSYQQNKKLYDIISVPAPMAPPSLENSNDRLVSIKELPEWARDAFPSNETQSLNRIQSKIFPLAFGTDENLLLCAPTGSGKTNVAMLTILRTMSNYRDEATGQLDLKKFKVVYVAPLKALVQEQMREFQRRLTPTFGIIVNELTGDSRLTRQQLDETHIIVTTPEKWDIVTRKGSESLYLNLTRLIILDEIHLLHDERGPVIESIVSRTVRQVEKMQDNIRLVGLSATLPNYKDVAKFLRVNFQKGLFFFDSSYRPCPLEQKFIGIKEKKAIKKLNAMNEACYDRVYECLQNKHQVIIFVHSRKETFKTAKWLISKFVEEDKADMILKPGSGADKILKEEANNSDNKNLKEILGNGIGIHHAGLKKDERTVVEDLFAQGLIPVLVSTATLAWGVNLPAHTVIIKGTETYSPEKGSWVQLSPQDILQMLGRAGRPRYDKSGEGIIITPHEELQYYLAVLNQQLPIESQLMSKLPDVMNAEIALGSINSRDDAVEWLKYTYLFIRMLNSPAVYHVGAEYDGDKSLFYKRLDLSHTALTMLRDNKLIDYDPLTGKVRSTELGKIASHFYINYETINMYNRQLKPWTTEIGVLRVFAMSGEFKLIPVRQEEKMEISKLSEMCPIPIRENPGEHLAKVNVLLQTYISRLTLDGFALMADMVYITQSAGRLLRAIFEISLRKGWSSLSKITLNLCKMVEKRMWLANSPLRQFGSLASSEIIRKTEASHLPWKNYFDLNAAELAEIINLKGNSQNVYDLVRQFPRLFLNTYAYPITYDTLRVQVDIRPEWKWNVNLHGNFETFLVLVEDSDGEKILYRDEVVIHKTKVNKDHVLEFTVPVLDPIQRNYYVTLMNEKWLQAEYRIPIDLSNLKIPKKFQSPTPLLDLENIPTHELKVPDYDNIFDFSYFNKYQSQLFQCLYKTNENVFAGMAKGNGKSVCIELLVLNHWRQNKGRIVYINESEEIIDKYAKRWKKKFAKITEEGKVVSKLTGSLSTDLKLLSSSHLTLATPEQFDYISKRWRQRKVIRSIDLFIGDDAHMIGDGISGVSYEIIFSRMRLISTQVDHPIRLAAFSHPITNARDFGEWIGCSKQNIYNFSPESRFQAIKEIRINSSKSKLDDSLLSLTNPCFQYLSEKNAESKSIIFVPSRKNCVDVGFDILNKEFIHGTQMLEKEVCEIEPFINRISDSALAELVRGGVAVYYKDMDTTDKLIVERLFERGIINLLVASRDTSFYCPQAHNIVILGTLEYDGKENRYEEYKINEILEMVGCCNNELFEANVLLFTEPTKMEYYSKFINTPLPIESNLVYKIHDVFMNEISTKTFRTRQDCVDWTTFSFFYRRLRSNPSFYELKDTSHLGISEFLSELVESTLKDLSEANIIELQDAEEDESVDEEGTEEEIIPNGGAMIGSFYNISFFTIKEFARITSKTKLRGLLEVICSAQEFESLPIRANEENILRKLYQKLPVSHSQEDYSSPFFKTFVLLQAHLSRVPLALDLARDQKFILKKVVAVINACVDYLASEGNLNTLYAMDISQMVIQAVWNKDSPLKQIPHFDAQILARCEKYKVETVYDLMALEDDERDDVLRLQDDKLNAVANFVNSYPNIELSYELDQSQKFVTNETIGIRVIIERDEEVDDFSVAAAFYPWQKDESWWVIIGDSATRQLYAIKKTTIGQTLQLLDLEFAVPTAGTQSLSVWCICDSYMDADKELSFDITLHPNEDAGETAEN